MSQDAVPPVRLGIVDDHEIILDAVGIWVERNQTQAVRNQPGIELVVSSQDPHAAMQVADRLDVLILDVDLGLEDLPTWEFVERFTGRGVHVLIVSAGSDADATRAAIGAGACGFVPKRVGLDSIMAAVLAVRDGEMYATADLAAALASGEQRPGLSDRELTSLQLFASGLSKNAVAERMGVDASSVDTYIKRVRKKYRELGRLVSTKPELLKRAQEDGYLT
jgi:DNA-binding NarL/FixJ family response regulator